MSVLYPDDRLYHPDALWLQIQANGEALVGINHFAQSSLGEVMFIDLPRTGDALSIGASFGTIESTKVVSDLIAPASGSVLEINRQACDEPVLVNRDPYGTGWLLRIRLSSPAEIPDLFDAAGYIGHIGLEAA
ncbi:glycine cleavage system protein H [Betaproteobacteria bacterium SCN1]|jgi:glycine cleavage system H protein|nr:glycine cleavage system protein H [Betaproteobacteria bacterium SCN1]MBN8761102.1 glycine cleavage system protein H [Thiobacillus sp.]ODU87532.1 MAG: glycine cleavage system protein H [Thiobacillus sp. SCN 65-179]OJW38719.1 MAG: glycine cleavage system protein H [Thiobacillus sp. 65-69]